MNRLTMMAGTLVWYAGGCSVAFDLAQEHDSIDEFFYDGIGEYSSFSKSAAYTLSLITPQEYTRIRRLQELGEARLFEIKQEFARRVLELPMREVAASMFCFFICSLSSDQERDIRTAFVCAQSLTFNHLNAALERESCVHAIPYLLGFWKEYHGKTPD